MLHLLQCIHQPDRKDANFSPIRVVKLAVLRMLNSRRQRPRTRLEFWAAAHSRRFDEPIIDPDGNHIAFAEALDPSLAR